MLGFVFEFVNFVLLEYMYVGFLCVRFLGYCVFVVFCFKSGEIVLFEMKFDIFLIDIEEMCVLVIWWVVFLL